MSSERLEFRVLLDRVRQGDEAAARELFELFEPHVRRVVRTRLPHAMRSKFDSVDFVQSVWGDFFDRLRRGEISFDTPQQLSRFLTLAARAKVTNEYKRRLRTEKCNLAKEISIQQGNREIKLTSHEPTPSQEAVAHERLDAIMAGRPELHRQVLRLRGEGYTFPEIAYHVGIDERSARRIVHSVAKELGLNDAGK